jgi:hypothetical protein
VGWFIRNQDAARLEGQQAQINEQKYEYIMGQPLSYVEAYGQKELWYNSVPLVFITIILIGLGFVFHGFQVVTVRTYHYHRNEDDNDDED